MPALEGLGCSHIPNRFVLLYNNKSLTSGVMHECVIKTFKIMCAKQHIFGLKSAFNFNGRNLAYKT